MVFEQFGYLYILDACSELVLKLQNWLKLAEIKTTSCQVPLTYVGWLANHRLCQRKAGLAASLVKGKVHGWMGGWK